MKGRNLYRIIGSLTVGFVLLLSGCGGGGGGILSSSGFNSFEVHDAGSAYKKFIPGESLYIEYDMPTNSASSVSVFRPDGRTDDLAITTESGSHVLSYVLPPILGTYTVRGDIAVSNDQDLMDLLLSSIANSDPYHVGVYHEEIQIEVVNSKTVGSVEVSWAGAPVGSRYRVELLPAKIVRYTSDKNFSIPGLVPATYTVSVMTQKSLTLLVGQVYQAKTTLTVAANGKTTANMTLTP